MNILLTNDDGYKAPGINLLFEKLKSVHEVYLCAPMRQMSASSHAITLFKPMEMLKLSSRSFAVDGTPADCIKAALFHFFSGIKIDIIISGINDGANMGDDILYSGTVAGAREGSLNNIFSIAASVDGWQENKDFTFPVLFLSELLHNLGRPIYKSNLMLNINFPGNVTPMGIKVTHLGKRVYRDKVIVQDRAGKHFITITGDEPGFDHDEGSDLNCVSEGLISITPLANEITDPASKKMLKYLETLSWAVFQGGVK
jgi:5'-nucleotidase